MATVLIVYATTEGHTRRVATRIAEQVGEYGHTAVLVDAAGGTSLAPAGGVDGVIVAASVHRQRHQAHAARWVRANLPLLRDVPTAFFSISLSAAGDARLRDEARRYARRFLRQTRWHPTMARLVAGALAYTRYDRLTRWRMRLIAWRRGGDTDTSRDHEYTNWERLRHDVDRFLALAVPSVAMAAT